MNAIFMTDILEYFKMYFGFLASPGVFYNEMCLVENMTLIRLPESFQISMLIA